MHPLHMSICKGVYPGMKISIDSDACRGDRHIIAAEGIIRVCTVIMNARTRTRTETKTSSNVGMTVSRLKAEGEHKGELLVQDLSCTLMYFIIMLDPIPMVKETGRLEDGRESDVMGQYGHVEFIEDLL